MDKKRKLDEIDNGKEYVYLVFCTGDNEYPLKEHAISGWKTFEEAFEQVILILKHAYKERKLPLNDKLLEEIRKSMEKNFNPSAFRESKMVWCSGSYKTIVMHRLEIGKYSCYGPRKLGKR